MALLEAFVSGLLTLITEELLLPPLYAWEALVPSVILGIAVLRFLLPRTSVTVSWVTSGAVVAGMTSLVRVAVVFGRYVSFVQGADAFAIKDFHGYTYLLFVLSGGVAGALLARREPARSATRALALVGLSLGVLYHLKISQSWMFMYPTARSILFTGEFLSPAIFAYVFSLFGGGRRGATGTETSRRCGEPQ